MTTGRKAYCVDCPQAKGPYGEPVYVGQVFTEGRYPYNHAWAWKAIHEVDNPGHHVRIDHFTTIEFDVENINPELWRILTGG